MFFVGEEVYGDRCRFGSHLLRLNKSSEKTVCHAVSPTVFDDAAKRPHAFLLDWSDPE